MLCFENVTYRYRTGDPPALTDVSLALAPGEFVAVVGANGSGKSTLALLCDGLLLPEGGRVVVDGVCTADDERSYEVRSAVGMVFQDPDDQIVGTVVEEDCAFGPENLGLPASEIRTRVDEALAAVSLAGSERREPHLLSEGEKQRLAVAGALAMRPRYLVADEALAMLDPDGRRDVLALLRSLAADGHGVLLVTHDAAAIGRADRVIGLAGGSVVYDGRPEPLFADGALMETLGVEPTWTGRIAARLREAGVPVPAATMDGADLEAALWP